LPRSSTDELKAKPTVPIFFLEVLRLVRPFRVRGCFGISKHLRKWPVFDNDKGEEMMPTNAALSGFWYS
jgi:hypothetical protein